MTLPKVVRIGTRGSKLALAQAGDVKRRLEKANPGVRFRLVVVRTEGDEFQSVELFRKNGTGFFTKAIEEKLLAGRIDAAVHSLKDLPTKSPRGLTLAAVPKRLVPTDVLVSRRRFSLRDLPAGATVGTGSPRRKRQILLARPDIAVRDIRGNLDTRVKKVLSGELAAIVVAQAGLLRLGKYMKYARPIPAETMLPAVGQAALGIQARATDTALLKALRKINHRLTEIETGAERAFLEALRGGCRVPVGIASRISGGRIRFSAAVFSVKGPGAVRGERAGALGRANAVACALAADLLRRGAARLMREARSAGEA